MSELDAYAAGIVDGEGCLTMYRSNHGGKSRTQYCPRIQVNMGDTGPLLILEDLYGGSLFMDKKPRSPKHRIMYSWYLNSRGEMENALSCIFPYLKVKHLQAQVLMHYFNKFNPGETHDSNRDVYVNLIRALNGERDDHHYNVVSLLKSEGIAGVLD